LVIRFAARPVAEDVEWRRRFFVHFDYVVFWDIIVIIGKQTWSVAWSRWWTW
jgi:hypothetical protein